MSSTFDFDRRITALLDEQAPQHAPDALLETVAERVSRTRHRPAWATLERWIAMETRSQFGAVPRTAIILVVLGVLLAFAGAIALAQQPTIELPPPYGPASNGLIAFDANGDIWVAEADGSSPRSITTGDERDSSPAFSRDGTRLAYWERAATETAEHYEVAPSNLVVMDADGSDPRTLLSDARVQAINLPVWSPDGQLLLVATEGPDGDHIVAVDVDTGDATELATGSNPSWAPDGRRIVFDGANLSDPGVYVADLSGGAPRKVSHIAAEDYGVPEWSPDGTRIVFFTPTMPGNEDVWVVNEDGTGEIAISDDPADEYWASWSPDSSLIAYDRWDTDLEGNHLVVAEADGSSETVLGGPIVDGSAPIWSPDGTRVYAWQYAEPWGDYAIGVYDVTNESPPITILTPGNRGYGSWQRLASK